MHPDLVWISAVKPSLDISRSPKKKDQNENKEWEKSHAEREKKP